MATATPKAKPAVRIKMRIKKGDTVQVITGKDKGKTGEVLRTLPYENKVLVQGINLRTRHVKPTQEGETGRIVTEEAAVHASNVMLYSQAKKRPAAWGLLSTKTAPKSGNSRKLARSWIDSLNQQSIPSPVPPTLRPPTCPVSLLTPTRSALPLSPSCH